MTDIVNELRNLADEWNESPGSVHLRAADEIERLTREREAFRALADSADRMREHESNVNREALERVALQRDIAHGEIAALTLAVTDPTKAAASVKLDVVRGYLAARGWTRDSVLATGWESWRPADGSTRFQAWTRVDGDADARAVSIIVAAQEQRPAAIILAEWVVASGKGR